MNSYLKIDETRKKLKEITGLGYFNGGHSELICRCPFPNCELEQGKTYHYGRLYIDLGSPVFHCFRCQTSGSIFKLFQYLKLNVKEYVVEGHESLQYKGSRRCIHINTANANIVDIIDKLKIPGFDANSINFNKKSAYLKSRLGSEVDLSTVPNLVLKIREFVNNNRVELTKYDESMLELYDRQYVGFLSTRGTMITLRKTFGEGDDYRKLQIAQPGEFKDFYALRSGHIKNDKINKIILCEGIFDLLVSMKSYELRDLYGDSVYWAAALGSHYKKLIDSLLHYVRLPMVDVVVLSDKDKKPDDPIYKALRSSSMVRNLEIYWNKLGHDFGAYPIQPIKTVFQQQSFSNYRKRTTGKSFR